MIFKGYIFIDNMQVYGHPVFFTKREIIPPKEDTKTEIVWFNLLQTRGTINYRTTYTIYEMDILDSYRTNKIKNRIIYQNLYGEEINALIYTNLWNNFKINIIHERIWIMRKENFWKYIMAPILTGLFLWLIYKYST